MYYYLLPHEWWSRLNFPDQSEASGSATAPIASRVWQSEAPKTLSLNAACLKETLPSYLILDNPDYRRFPVQVDNN